MRALLNNVSQLRIEAQAVIEEITPLRVRCTVGRARGVRERVDLRHQLPALQPAHRRGCTPPSRTHKIMIFS